MSTDNPAQTGRALLKMAHEAAQDAMDVFLHGDGFGPISVCKVDPIDEHATLAVVRCWANEDAKANVWLIPLVAVRAVQIQGDWLG